MSAERTAASKKEGRSDHLLVPLVIVLGFLGASCADATDTDAATPASESAARNGRNAIVSITYLANEGFLLEAGESVVLIDALFGDGLKGYPAIPQPLRDEIENGRGRFNGVDCVLVTHTHGDHFNPQAVASFLSRVPAQLISTSEAVEDVLSSHGRLAGPKPRWLRPARHSFERVDCGGVPVTAMSFHHGRLMVNNLAYLVDLGGLKVLHVGDTEITADEIRPWNLDALEIDVALLPVWFLTEPSWSSVVEEIGAHHLVAMHLASPDAPSSWFGSAGSLENRIESIRRQIPSAWIPTEPLASRTFSGGTK